MADKKVKVEVIGAEVDGNPVGSMIEIAEKSANSLEKRGYVKYVADVAPKKAAPKKTKPAPKKKEKTEDK